MKRYTVLIERPVILTLGLGQSVILEIEIECETEDEIIRHAHTLKKRGDKVIKIYPTGANLWKGESE